jgi:acyl-ACP thioesterase
MYHYREKVSYSHSDEEGNLRLGSIIDSFQDCSQMHSEVAGVSVERLWKMRAGWQIVSWQIEVKRYPKFGEEVVVGTWPNSFRGAAGGRNYSMDTIEGERLVVANSVWALVNLDTHRVMAIPKDIVACYELEEPAEMEKVSRKVALPEQMEKLEELVVPKRSRDTNGHMNNSYYVHFSGEHLPEERKVQKLRVEYKLGSYPGETLTLWGAWMDEKFYTAFRGPEQELRAGLEFSFF